MRALLLSLVPLAGGACAAASSGAPVAATLPLLLQGGCALRAWSQGFAPAPMKLAIELAPAWLLWSLIVLTK